MISKQALAVLLAVVALVAFYGGFLLGSRAKNLAGRSQNSGVTIPPTPTPTNPLGEVKTNPFEDLKFNPFK